MAPSTFLYAKEVLRRSTANDFKFVKRMVYFFELKVPATLLGWRGSYIFPLALNPTDISMDEPFALEAQPTQGAGLYVEENGIVQRSIKIRGHTGFRPRTLLASGILGMMPAPPAGRSFTRNISPVMGELSGQRHFQWLQDRVFRTYSDLKRDPSTSEGTQLIWHNQKDDEHWLVAPRSFNLTRSAAKPTMYEYSIDLLVLDRAEVAVPISEDASWLDTLRNAIALVQTFLNLVQGAIQDLTAAIAEIRAFISTIDNLIDSVTQIIDAATDFVNGLKDFIDIPFKFLQSTIDLADSFMESVASVRELYGEALAFPDNLVNSARQLIDASEHLGQRPDLFRKSSGNSLQAMIALTRPTAATASAKAAEAAGVPSAGSFNDFRTLGTGPMPGDIERGKKENLLGVNAPKFASARVEKIAQGDTLQAMASRYLGDARLWRHIAVLNGLKPPFISDLAIRDLSSGAPLPGTLGRGATILIPSYAPPPLAQQSFATLGVEPDDPIENHLLGADLELKQNAKGQFEIPINVEQGGIDGKIVRGIANLAQGIQSRLRIERGHDLLYRSVGMQRVVGLGSTLVDSENVKFRAAEAVQLDPRVAGVTRLTVEDPGDTRGADRDSYILDIEVEVRGFGESLAFQTTAQVA